MKKIDFTLAYDYSVMGDGSIPHDTPKAITVPTLVMDGENTMDLMHVTADRVRLQLILIGTGLIPIYGIYRKLIQGETFGDNTMSDFGLLIFTMLVFGIIACFGP